MKLMLLKYRVVVVPFMRVNFNRIGKIDRVEEISNEWNLSYMLFIHKRWKID